MAAAVLLSASVLLVRAERVLAIAGFLLLSLGRGFCFARAFFGTLVLDVCAAWLAFVFAHGERDTRLGSELSLGRRWGEGESYAALMKLMLPLGSRTHHLTSSRCSIP